MGSVIKSLRFSRERKIHLFIFAMYFIGAFAFLTIGLQPAKNSAAVYASESQRATAILGIPSISLEAPVTPVELNGSELEVPEQIAGSYSVHTNKTLIIGHSSTIFQNLAHITLGSELTYDHHNYVVTNLTEKPKSDISMKEILQAEDEDTIIIMTCSGSLIEGSNGDHTHRLIVTAKML